MIIDEVYTSYCERGNMVLGIERREKVRSNNND